MCVRLNNLIQLKELYNYIYQSFKTQMQNLKQDYIEKILKRKSENSKTSSTNGFSINYFKKLLANSIHENNLKINNISFKLNQTSNGLVQLLVYRVNIWVKRIISCYDIFCFCFNYSSIYFVRNQSTCLCRKNLIYIR